MVPGSKRVSIRSLGDVILVAAFQSLFIQLSAGRKCMFWQRSKHRGTSHIIYNSRSLSKLYKAKTNKKESGLINEKRNKLAQAWKKEKNSTVYLTTVQKPTVHGVARVANFMKPLHLVLKHSSPKNNNSLSSRKSETQVVKDWLKW